MILRVLIAIVFLMEGNAFSESGPGTVYSDDFAGDFGEMHVGLRFDDLVDKSRTYAYPGQERTSAEFGRGGRAIRIYTWYPAAIEEEAEQMTLGRYIEISKGDFHVGRHSVIIPDKLPLARALSDEQLSAMVMLSTNALENAEPAKGQFPLIVFGQGLYYENPITHFALCEYFASHGFVITSCPLVGTNSPMVMLTVRDLESIVRDLEFVLEFSLDQPYVDRDRIGIIGFDMGGMAAQPLQMRNSRVDAIMTLDAGIVFSHFSGLPGNHPSFDLQLMTSPWLHMTQTKFIEAYRERLDQSVWGKISADRYLLLFDDVQHVNFTSYGLLNIPAPLIAYWGDNILPNVPVYSTICRIGLTFMNAYLKNNQEDLRRLIDEIDSQNPDRGFTLENKQGVTPGPTLDQFLNQIISGDIEKAVGQARLYKKTNPSWSFYSESVVNDIGYRFLYALNRPQIALEIFRLNMEMNPQSGNVYDSYAEALLALDRVEEAIENYEKSLKLDPENQNASKILNDLKNR
ncbi:MAG: hypothetical protein JSU85_12310 [Candidatus Zixiibacteriota bacterium]|nr:MAG: hypothetical protein JSU85_12310 [candidate division Zixibacteria bacterium]